MFLNIMFCLALVGCCGLVAPSSGVGPIGARHSPQLPRLPGTATATAPLLQLAATSGVAVAAGPPPTLCRRRAPT